MNNRNPWCIQGVSIMRCGWGQAYRTAHLGAQPWELLLFKRLHPQAGSQAVAVGARYASPCTLNTAIIQAIWSWVLSKSFSCVADFPLKLPLPYTFYFYHLFSYKIDSKTLALVFHASFLLLSHFLLDRFPFPVFLFFNFSFCLLLGGFSIFCICLQTLPVLFWRYSCIIEVHFYSLYCISEDLDSDPLQVL